VPRILISPGFGAGWASWADSDKAKAVAEYQPIIDYIDNGGDPSKLNLPNGHHPLVTQMMEDLKLTYFYAGGASDLEVRETSEPYKIDEYDGSEYLVTVEDLW